MKSVANKDPSINGNVLSLDLNFNKVAHVSQPQGDSSSCLVK